MKVMVCKCGRYRFDERDTWIDPRGHKHCSINPMATAKLLNALIGGLEEVEEECPKCLTKRKEM